MNEIKENELQLVITKKELGSLTTNAKVIKEKVKELLSNYKAENYDESNIEKAKTDKAMLNKTSKLLNDERIKIEKEFMKPFEEFKSEVTETCNLIKQASSEIDVIVKEVENREKEIIKNKIEDIFNSNVNELKEVLSLEKIFDDKWLNKGNWKEDGTFKLEKDLIDRINVIRNDLLTIGELNSKYEIELKNDYLSHFQLGEVIRKNNDLIQKEELLKKQQEETKKEIEHQKEVKVEEMLKKPAQQEVIDPIQTYTLRITGELSKIKKLREFMDLNNIEYVRIEN